MTNIDNIANVKNVGTPFVYKDSGALRNTPFDLFNNMIAARGVEGVTREDVDKLERTYNIIFSKNFTQNVIEYIVVYYIHLRKNSLSKDLIYGQCRRLANLFALGDKEYWAIIKSAEESFFSLVFLNFCRKGDFSLKCILELKKIQEDSSVSDERAFELQGKERIDLIKKQYQNWLNLRVNPDEISIALMELEVLLCVPHKNVLRATAEFRESSFFQFCLKDIVTGKCPCTEMEFDAYKKAFGFSYLEAKSVLERTAIRIAKRQILKLCSNATSFEAAEANIKLALDRLYLPYGIFKDTGDNFFGILKQVRNILKGDYPHAFAGDIDLQDREECYFRVTLAQTRVCYPDGDKTVYKGPLHVTNQRIIYMEGELQQSIGFEACVSCKAIDDDGSVTWAKIALPDGIYLEIFTRDAEIFCALVSRLISKKSPYALNR